MGGPLRALPAVIGNFMVLRDSHHLAPPFARALAGHLGRAPAGGVAAVPTSGEWLGGGVGRGRRVSRPDVRSELGDDVLRDASEDVAAGDGALRTAVTPPR